MMTIKPTRFFVDNSNNLAYSMAETVDLQYILFSNTKIESTILCSKCSEKIVGSILCSNCSEKQKKERSINP